MNTPNSHPNKNPNNQPENHLNNTPQPLQPPTGADATRQTRESIEKLPQAAPVMQLTINETKVFFDKPFTAFNEEIFRYIEEHKPARVVFIDIAPMQGLLDGIKRIQEISPGTQIFIRDHHDVEGEPNNDRERAIREIAEDLLTMPGVDAVISNRMVDPACSSLVEQGEFSGPDTLIIADTDPDGLTAAMKAAGLSYDDLESDAAVLDGPRVNQTKEGGLSDLAVLFTKGLATLPIYDAKNPLPAVKAKQELFEKFMQATQGEESAKKWLESKVTEYETQVEAANELAKNITKVADGVYMVDTCGAPKHHLGTLLAALESQPGCKVTVVRKDIGPLVAQHGVQYSLAVVKNAQAEVNLQTLLPEGFVSSIDAGIISNTTFLLHVNEAVWQTVVQKLKSQ